MKNCNNKILQLMTEKEELMKLQRLLKSIMQNVNKELKHERQLLKTNKQSASADIYYKMYGRARIKQKGGASD